MVTLSSVFILMSVLSGALAIPFLNNPQLTTVNNYDEGLSPVMASELTPEEAGKYPGKVSTSFGPNEFTFETETAFGTFTTEISNKAGPKLVQKLENINNTVEHKISDQKEEWILKGNEYSLKSSRAFDTVSETFSNPEGSCVRTLHLGVVSEQCTGQLYKMEESLTKSREIMKTYMEYIKNATEDIDFPDMDSESGSY